MNGKFYTDITRDTFKRNRHFSRVLMQQGRVQLDADWNEQSDLLLHYMRTVTADILGPHAGPQGDSFKITPRPDTSNVPFEFLVGEGRYYVDGLLIENDHEQYVQYIPQNARPTDTPITYLFYLDVWEYEVTYIEDDQMREVALGGPDTATRSEVVWRILVANTADMKGAPSKTDPQYNPNQTFDLKTFGEAWTKFLHHWLRVNHGQLKARPVEVEKPSTDPCITPPSAQFRGQENQLYRVEIHHPGEAGPEQTGTQSGSRRAASGPSTASSNYATFKWSRENGSIVFPIVGMVESGTIAHGSTITVTIEGLGRDQDRFSLAEHDWVELVDLEDAREGGTGPLLQVQVVDPLNMQVTLLTNVDIALDADSLAAGRQLLRRWDQKNGDLNQKGAITLADDGAAMLVENKWLTLEHGVQVLFHRDEDTGQHQDKDLDDMTPKYHTGDYWLIPARTAVTGGIEWPSKKHEHFALPPHGVAHHYAPLAIVTVKNKNGQIDESQSADLRRQIGEIW
jgi:hypothetical protein